MTKNQWEWGKTININIKDVIDFCWCPMYYELKKQDTNYNLREAYDKALHKCFYSYLIALQNDEISNSMELLKKRWGKEWIKQKRNSQIICTPSAYKRDTYDAKRKAGINAIETFNKLITKESQFPIIINHEYKVKITDDITLTGVWEYVREIERDGKSVLQLIKFKSDNNRFNINHQNRHDLELTAAAYAFKENFNSSNIEIIYVDIYKKKMIVSYRSEKDFALLKHTVTSVVKCLNNNIKCISPDKKCYHCEYRDVCAEKI